MTNGDRARRDALDELAAGPLPLAELMARLLVRGSLDEWRDLDEDSLADALDEILLESDDLWTTPDNVVAATATLLDGVVFTHRVSERERLDDELELAPDLEVLDVAARDDLSLTSGGRLTVRYDGSPDGVAGGLLTGPPGWLAAHPSPIVGLTRRGATATVVDVAVGDLDPGDRESVALARAFDEEYETGVAQEVTELVLNALAHDPSLFRRPVPPIRELLAHANLEADGSWVGRVGEDAQSPLVALHEYRVAELGERFGFDSCCHEAFDRVLEAWYRHLEIAVTPTPTSTPATTLLPWRDVARDLAHGAVAPALVAFVLVDETVASEDLAAFARPLARLTGPLAAPGHYLLARNLEADDEGLAGEAALRAALRADPTYEPALVELAWCASDRGDAARAVQLLSRVTGPDVSDELARQREYARPAVTGVGRNDPCPCGSGAKYKACCQGRPAPLEERTGWLYHKIVTFAQRPGQRPLLRDLLDVALEACGDLDDERVTQLLPLVGDLAAMDEDSLEHFLDARAGLLPEDEASLVRTWETSRPGLFQVTAVVPGVSLDLLDTRDARAVHLLEQSGSRGPQVGDYLYARVVEVGATPQLLGALIPVPLSQRPALLAILDDDGGDPFELAAWLGGLFAPPSIVNREGEATVLCRAVARPTTTWPALAARLDAVFGPAADDRWSEVVEIDGETVVRSFLLREGDELIVLSNSTARFARTLDRLEGEVGDLVFLSRDAPYEPDSVAPPRDEVLDPALAAHLAAFVAEREAAWLDESIPALHGLTPREAAADPTHREDLVALLNEFERYGPAPAGAATFDVARLRRALGLD